MDSSSARRAWLSLRVSACACGTLCWRISRICATCAAVRLSWESSEAAASAAGASSEGCCGCWAAFCASACGAQSIKSARAKPHRAATRELSVNVLIVETSSETLRGRGDAMFRATCLSASRRTAERLTLVLLALRLDRAEYVCETRHALLAGVENVVVVREQFVARPAARRTTRATLTLRRGLAAR